MSIVIEYPVLDKRGFPSYRKSKTHCPKGHPYSDENTFVSKTGSRSCRTCIREGKRARYVKIPRKKKEYCIHGHPYSEGHPNTGFLASGKKFCKTCAIERQHAAPRDKKLAYCAKWRAKNPEIRKNAMRRMQLRRYNMDEAAYFDMFQSQGGACAICRKPCKSGRRLAVDHCHETQKVRGLLCLRCNQGLGHFEDNIALLNDAQIYLWKSGTGNLHHLTQNE